mgnify:CR=1 FL=1
MKPYWKIAAWMLVVLILSAIPGSSLHKMELPFYKKIYLDKIIHACIYCVLCILLIMAMRNKQIKLPVVWALVIAIIYGGLMELAQKYIFTGRSAEWLDFGANTFGALAGAFIKRKPVKKDDKKNTAP